MKNSMVKVGNRLSDVQHSHCVLYNGYKVISISDTVYQLVNPNGDRKVFTVADGIITAVCPWNTNPPIVEVN